MNISKLIKKSPAWARRHKVIKLILLFFPRYKIQLIEFNYGAKLFGDISEPDIRGCLISGKFEPEFFRVCLPFLPEDKSCFFDVGANTGFCSFGVLEKRLSSNIDIHAFEANSDLCSLLKKSAGLYPSKKIQVNWGCVSDFVGSSRLLTSRSKTVLGFISDGEGIEVPNILLDEYIDKRNIYVVDLLKIDVEGWELHVLQGAKKSLKKGIIKNIYLEIVTSHLARANTSAEEIYDLLIESGYSVYWCKADNFERKDVSGKDAKELSINGVFIHVAAVERQKLPKQFSADWLAIHN